MSFLGSLSRQADLEEMMDDPNLSPEKMAETLRGLGRVNRVLGGYGPSIHGVGRLVGERGKVTILDVGSGGGDTALEMVAWGRRQGIEVEVEGIDLSASIVSFAREQTREEPKIQIREANLFELGEERQYDVVHAALMLHHLPEAEVGRALQKMYALSRLGVVINDLHRHRAGYLASRVVLPAISRCPMVRHDGPVSILRAFSRAELFAIARESGLPEPEVRWWPFFRWQMILRREK